MPSGSKKLIISLLEAADIRVGGKRPWDVQVHDERLYDRVLAQGTLGLGEAYMDGWWDAEALDETATRFILAGGDRKVSKTLGNVWRLLSSKLINMQTRRRAQKVALEHYDLDNELYAAFLDPYNQYTCGYFKDTDDLNKAQEQKLDLICRKLQLKKEDRVLDIGSGWGGFSRFAAEHYGCHVTGISISGEQVKYAQEFTRGLPVEIKKLDYRDLTGQFDKILICGMIEHVGYKNYREIFEVVRRVLAPNGLFLLHTIGRNDSATASDPWFDKYIFPNSMLPSVVQIAKASEGLFVMEDWHNFGAYYDLTLRAWWRNFEAAWPKLKHKYDERFYRMWRYYLLSLPGSFRARDTQLWQVVFSPQGIAGGYRSVR